MNWVRRRFLKLLGIAPVTLVVPSSVQSVSKELVEKATLDTILPDVGTLKFQAYVLPEIVGWKGYWYRESPGVIPAGTVRVPEGGSLSNTVQDYSVNKTNIPRMTCEIVAFESLDGTRVASPWVLQSVSNHYNKYRG